MGGPKDNKKRKALSVDDLMRMQEQPSSKRFREDFQEDSAESDSASSSTSSISQSQEQSDDSSNEDEDEEHSDISSSDDEENDEISPNNLSLFDESTDRFSSSRISIVPRTALPKAPINPPTTSTPRPTSFASFGISHALLTALSKMSIKAPTEIQAACIPPILEGEYNIL